MATNREKGIDRRVSEPVYPKDVLSEVTLVMAPPDVKGAWVWALLILWDNDKPSHTATLDEWGRIWGCSAVEADSLVKEIHDREIGIVTRRHEKVTLTSRRLRRRHKVKEGNRIRKARQRVRDGCHGGVTRKKGASSSSSSVSSSDNPSEEGSSSERPTSSSPRGKSDPDLERIHRECPELRGLSWEHWTLAKRNRSAFLDYDKAVTELIRRASLEMDIRKPGIWVDRQLGYWEADHREDIARRKKAHDEREAATEQMAATIADLGGDPDEPIFPGTDRTKGAALKDMKSTFTKQWGPGALQDAQERAETKGRT
jgi:hypothetical protein